MNTTWKEKAELIRQGLERRCLNSCSQNNLSYPALYSTSTLIAGQILAALTSANKSEREWGKDEVRKLVMMGKNATLAGKEKQP